MRHVFDIDHKTSVISGGDEYAKRKGQDKAHGFRVSLSFHVRSGWGGEQPECLHVEGNAKYVRDALAEAVKQIDLIGNLMVSEDRLEEDWADVDGEKPNDGWWNKLVEEIEELRDRIGKLESK